MIASVLIAGNGLLAAIPIGAVGKTAGGAWNPAPGISGGRMFGMLAGRVKLA